MKNKLKITAVFAAVVVMALSASACMTFSIPGITSQTQSATEESSKLEISIDNFEVSDISDITNSAPDTLSDPSELSEENSSEISFDDSSVEESSSASVEASEEKKNTIYDIFENADAKQEIEQTEKAQTTDQYSLKISALDSETIVYTFQFTSPIDNSDGTYTSLLQQGAEQQKSFFVSSVKALETQYNVENVKLKIEYLNSDGSTIFEQTFTSEG